MTMIQGTLWVDKQEGCQDNEKQQGRKKAGRVQKGSIEEERDMCMMVMTNIMLGQKQQ